jgi:hypothetical protein
LADGATLALANRVPKLIDLSPESLWPYGLVANRLPDLTAKPDFKQAQTPPSATTPAGPSALPELPELPLHAALGQCQNAAREVSDQLCALFFTHSGEARYSVGA